MSKQPIGIFDSGVGGTSIWKEIHKLLPNENCIYLADSKNAPYGSKDKKDIIALCVKNTEFLLKQNCKLIVVACNTATTNAISFLRENYNLPFIGIEPAIKPAALETKTKTVGILATKGTLTSELFYKTSTLHANGITVVEQIGEGLVPLVEQGKIDNEETHTLLKQYLEPMLKANIDHLVLGCTHYPYLIPAIKKILPNHIKIIDSGEAVARQTKAILNKSGLLNKSNNIATQEFYINTQPEVMQSLVGEEQKVIFKAF